MKTVRQIGLISDTHGLMRPEALAALKGAELIIHAGDVGRPEILTALRSLAPTVAIRGNIDKDPPCSSLPPTEVVEAGTTLIYILHDVNDLDLDPVVAGFQIVVSGHSHKPSQTERKGVLYINPGSAGPRRFRLPITVARLDLHRLPLQAEIIELPVSA
jgi:putative phosphoesterase